MRSPRRFAFVTMLALAGLTALGPPAGAIVLHTDEQVPAGQRPPDQVIGAWGHNASCVVVGPNLVLTTIHQGNASTVRIDGVAYDVVTPPGFSSPGSDIRIAELHLDGQPADLGYWVPLFRGDVVDEVLVLGGYGMGRGDTLTTSEGQPYGYAWDGSANTTLRWGQNRIEQVYDVFGLMTARFDGTDVPTALPYEAAVAKHDSGGGWFIHADGRWHLAGLTSGAQDATANRSVFASATDGSPAPNRIEAIRLGAPGISTWLDGMLEIAMPIPGDANRDGVVNYDDLVILAANYGSTGGAGWSSGNFSGDGSVGLVDLGILAAHYGYGVAEPLDFAADLLTVALPEPTTAALAGLGAMFALGRKRQRR